MLLIVVVIEVTMKFLLCIAPFFAVSAAKSVSMPIPPITPTGAVDLKEELVPSPPPTDSDIDPRDLWLLRLYQEKFRQFFKPTIKVCKAYLSNTEPVFFTCKGNKYIYRESSRRGLLESVESQSYWLSKSTAFIDRMSAMVADRIDKPDTSVYLKSSGLHYLL